MDKFHALAGIALARAQAESLAQFILTLDNIDDARAIVPLLAGHAEQQAAIR